MDIVEPGTPIVLDSDSPLADFGVVFEDDGETGYFYAIDLADDAPRILDAVQVYSVDAQDGPLGLALRIIWSEDGTKAGLLLGDQLHAAFDFTARAGYCLSGFPEAGEDWTRHDWRWTRAAGALFR